MKAPEDSQTDAPDQGVKIRKRRRTRTLQPWPLKWLIGLLILVVALMWLLGRM